MKLANILISKNALVTFINTNVNHQRLNPESSNEIIFKSFTDGLPPDHDRTDLKPLELCESMMKHDPPNVERTVESLKHFATNVHPISSIIADGVFSFT